MKAWELEEIRRAAKGKWLWRGDRAFSGRVAIDSRSVREGDLFIAIVGKTHDGHTFMREVLGREPAAVLVHCEPSGEELGLARAHRVSVILADHTVAALNRLAGAYRATVRAKVIAVSGSNGKTTTKRIIHQLLSEKYGSGGKKNGGSGGAGGGIASPKSFNNNIGMPLTLLEVEPWHEYVVLEVGTSAPGEIAALGAVCRPDIAVITSVGLEHLEQLGDLQGVAREEAAIGQFVNGTGGGGGSGGGTLVLPADAPELLHALKNTGAQKILVGSQEGVGDMAVTDVVEEVGAGGGGTQFCVNGRGHFFVPLLGGHNAVNALMAIAVARRLGVTDAQIAAGLRKVRPAEMRLEVSQFPLGCAAEERGGEEESAMAAAVSARRGGSAARQPSISRGTGKAGAGEVCIINDCYNANPSSMEAALRMFARLKMGRGGGGKRRLKWGRKVVVLGDMLELGPGSEAMHRTVGKWVAEGQFDLFVAVGAHMRRAAEAAGEVPAVHFATTAAACRGIGPLLRPGDAVLVKASRSMTLEKVIAAMRQGAAPATAAAGRS